MKNALFFTEKYIRYKTYGERVFLYNLKTHKTYILSAICADILDILKEKSTFSTLTDKLLQLYAVSEKDTFYNDITFFLNELVSKQIIGCIQGKKEAGDSLVEKQLVEECFQAQIPLNVLFELTYQCSERCRHCYAVGCEGPARKELTTEEIKIVLDDLKKMGILEITFTGGEVFTRKDAMDILRYATECGFVIDIFTNGICLSDDMIFEIADFYPRSIHFSLYSSKADVHDYITQVKGSFDKTLKVAKKFIRLGVAVNIKTVVMRVNSGDMQGLIELADKIGATIQIGTSVSAKNDRDTAPLDLRETDMEKMTDVFRRFYEKIDYCGDDDRKRDREATICGAGITGISIDPYGDVYPCTALKIFAGNVLKTPVSEIWENSQELKKWYQNKFNMIEECRTCDKADLCAFCPGTAMQEMGSPFTRYDEACFLTKAKAKALHK